MGFFKEEAMRLAIESISFLDDLDGQIFSLSELENKFPSLYANWEDWEYNMEDEEVTAVGSFGLDADTYDKFLTIRVRPIDNEYFVVYGAKVEENYY